MKNRKLDNKNSVMMLQSLFFLFFAINCSTINAMDFSQMLNAEYRGNGD